ncbi:hypothetical protein IEQ44_04025 [Nocardioides sp. Y6]|uniref:EfeO-type cupredoxin-like domain-containing protein n=1 Tax=Nocardioides malaquae TaxID=2773426 RepID=A0ABR9RQG4_9ACTN|nr:hypothetical protein [Nocardioides malaquae]MBE7323815.1 hypothetical protein [Nocardioides malaquae]
MSARLSPFRRHAVRGAALAMVASLALGACSGEAEETADGDDPQVIQVSITDDEVTPMGERFEVGAGEPFTVEITSDREGALHVHSTPEQEWEFSADETTVIDATIDQPGVVEVEMHDPDLVVLQLEVR